VRIVGLCVRWRVRRTSPFDYCPSLAATVIYVADVHPSMLVISLHGVEKGYPMGDVWVPVLRGISLDIEEGEFVGLFGPSGSGKTTLLNMISGIDRPDAGRILVNGEDITAYSRSEMTLYRRRSVGYIFQFYNLLPTLTALENVELALELDGRPDRRACIEVMREIGLGKLLDRFPAQLSGGEQQRVAIARAVVKRPAIIVGDEPTGNLDRKNSLRVVELLQGLNEERGISVIVATHDLTYRRFVGTAYKIVDGRVRRIQGG